MSQGNTKQQRNGTRNTRSILKRTSNFFVALEHSAIFLSRVSVQFGPCFFIFTKKLKARASSLCSSSSSMSIVRHPSVWIADFRNETLNLFRLGIRCVVHQMALLSDTPRPEKHGAQVPAKWSVKLPPSGFLPSAPVVSTTAENNFELE